MASEGNEHGREAQRRDRRSVRPSLLHRSLLHTSVLSPTLLHSEQGDSLPAAHVRIRINRRGHPESLDRDP